MIATTTISSPYPTSESSEDESEPFMLARPSLDVPPYIDSVRRLLWRRGARTRIIAAWAIVHVSMRRGRARFEYTVVPEEVTSLARTGAIVSLRVYAQDARQFPVDAVVTMFRAPRPYLLRRHVAVSTLDEELVDDGRVYADDACSLDAAGYTGPVATTPVPGLPGAAHVAATDRYAPLTRAIVGRAATLTTSDGFLLLDAAADLARADTEIRTVLVPHAHRTLQGARPRLGIHLLAPLSPRRHQATLWCRMYLVATTL